MEGRRESVKWGKGKEAGTERGKGRKKGKKKGRQRRKKGAGIERKENTMMTFSDPKGCEVK